MASVAPGLSAFFERTTRDTIVLTPNRRLSRFLQAQHAQFCVASEQVAWEAYACQSVNEWLGQLWLKWQQQYPQTVNSKLVLTSSQETAIWQNIIAEHSDDVALFNASATASIAQRAWHSLVQWRSCDEATTDTFDRWREVYSAFCEQRDLLDFPSMVALLSTALEQGQLTVPKRLVLFAFDDISPQLQHLFDCLKAKGGEVESFELSVPDALPARVMLSDIDAEILRAAQWAHALVSQASEAKVGGVKVGAAKVGGVKVGIIVPQLASIRAKVEHIFTRVFEPQYFMPDSARHASGFNISAATPLASAPPIFAALTALKLNKGTCDIESLSRLLHSPFIGITEELPSRVMLDAELRVQALTFPLNRICTALADFAKGAKDKGAGTVVSTRDLYQRLRNFQQLGRTASSKRAPSEWAEFFSQQLDALGWPGNRELDTLEYQQVEVWRTTLAQVASFDYAYPRVSLARAMDFVERLAFDTQFQAQTYDSSVQILGLFEGAGLVFDHLWVMSLDNESWPPSANPNPLLPLALQKRLNMPQASVARELELAQRLTRRFARAARSVVFSHSAFDGDKSLRPSPLIESFPLLDADTLKCSETADYWASIAATGTMESIVDTLGPILEAADMHEVRGGTQILKDQAACPFRAFAKHRLHARESQEAVFGLSPADRGSLIHDALEHVWKQLGDQYTLINMDEANLAAVVEQAIDKSLRSVEQHAAVGYTLKSLEKARMYALIRAWLALEKERAPFSVMFSEAQTQIRLETLPIQIRYDRVDQLEDGSLFILDYKTGNQNINAWSGERPDEPQVPLYGIANEDRVSGLAFGQVNVDEVAFKGISDKDDAVPGLSKPDALSSLDLPDDWEQVITHWRRVMEALAREFIEGYAEVSPKKPAQTCQYCVLHSLCRIKDVLEPLEMESRQNDGEVSSS